MPEGFGLGGELRKFELLDVANAEVGAFYYDALSVFG
jgi:hypothetical protein